MTSDYQTGQGLALGCFAVILLSCLGLVGLGGYWLFAPSGARKPPPTEGPAHANAGRETFLIQDLPMPRHCADPPITRKRMISLLFASFTSPSRLFGRRYLSSRSRRDPARLGASA